jgi:DNA primase
MADQVLQDIKERIDIVELIGSYIPLKKSGTNFKAVCPFHNENTPSLMISPQKQIWHCFGCGEGGDVFGFVMRYENIEFREALQMLAQRAGITLPEYRAQPRGAEDVVEALTRINNFASKYYHKLLFSENGKMALDYLHNRGLTDGTLEQWEIGYAPDSFESLIKALQSKQVDINQSLQAGVLGKNDRGTYYDRFRSRVMFPIHNYYGDVVGFSARTLEDKPDVAKYVNSPETPAYNKSKILFGLHFAREAIRRADEVVIVEGQMDVISAHQGGFANTVATSGTALTEQHLRLLGRLTKNLVFCFDADAAGQQAARRAGELALPLGFRVKMVVLDQVKDPDELIRKSPGLWKKAVAEAVWVVDFYIQKAQKEFASGSLEQAQFVSAEVIPLLRFVTNPLELDHYIRKLSEAFVMTEPAIRQSIQQAQGITQRTVEPKPLPNAVPPERILEKQILGGILTYPDFLRFVKEEGLPSDLLSPELRDAFTALLAGDPLPKNDLLDPLAREAQFMVESELENLANNELALSRELTKSFYLFKLAGLKQQLHDLTAAIKKTEAAQDAAAGLDLNKQFAALSNERMAIEAKLQQ